MLPLKLHDETIYIYMFKNIHLIRVNHNQKNFTILKTSESLCKKLRPRYTQTYLHLSYPPLTSLFRIPISLGTVLQTT